MHGKLCLLLFTWFIAAAAAKSSGVCNAVIIVINYLYVKIKYCTVCQVPFACAVSGEPVSGCGCRWVRCKAVVICGLRWKRWNRVGLGNVVRRRVKSTVHKDMRRAAAAQTWHRRARRALSAAQHSAGDRRVRRVSIVEPTSRQDQQQQGAGKEDRHKTRQNTSSPKCAMNRKRKLRSNSVSISYTRIIHVLIIQY